MKKFLSILFLLLVNCGLSYGNEIGNIKNKNYNPITANKNYKQSSSYVRIVFKTQILPEEEKFLKEKSEKNNDILFSTLQNKYIEVINDLNDKYYDEINSKDKYYKNNWVKILMCEGCNFYELNYSYLNKKYGKYLSPTYKCWLEHLKKTELIVTEGYLTVPPDEVRKNIIFLENFIKENPDFVRISDVKEKLNLYIIVYLSGLDNFPIFDRWDTKKMKSEYKKSYENFLNDNKTSQYYSLVEELYNKAKEFDFMFNEDFENWHTNSYAKKLLNE